MALGVGRCLGITILPMALDPAGCLMLKCDGTEEGSLCSLLAVHSGGLRETHENNKESFVYMRWQHHIAPSQL